MQLTGLCRVYFAEYYFENFALSNITLAEPRIVQCLDLFVLGAVIMLGSIDFMHTFNGSGYKILSMHK